MIREAGNKRQLTWLIRLRWIAALGQSLLFLIAIAIMELTLPVLPLSLLILLLIFSNLALHFLCKGSKNTSPQILGGVLIFDILLLTALLAFSGGPANPFSIVYIVHVSIAAMLLGSRWTWGMVVLATLCFAFLFRFHIGVPEMAMHHVETSKVFSAHLHGMLLAFVLVAALCSYFLSKLAEAVRTQEKEIGDLRILAAQEEKLASLTNLAAGAAHELATPLASIMVASSELRHALMHGANTSELLEDVNLILSETQYCKTIIENMAGQAGEINGELQTVVDSETLILALKEQVAADDLDRIDFLLEKFSEVKAPLSALTQSLSILLKNSLEASEKNSKVKVIAENANESTHFLVVDQGHGIPQEILHRVGEPFLTTKDPGKGMGLGLFLVKLFAKRLGGSFIISSGTEKGTIAKLSIPNVSEPRHLPANAIA